MARSLQAADVSAPAWPTIMRTGDGHRWRRGRGGP